MERVLDRTESTGQAKSKRHGRACSVRRCMAFWESFGCFKPGQWHTGYRGKVISAFAMLLCFHIAGGWVWRANLKERRTSLQSRRSKKYCVQVINSQNFSALRPFMDSCEGVLHSMWLTEKAIPEWFEAHSSWLCRNNAEPDHYLVSFMSKCFSRMHSDSSLDSLFKLLVREIRANYTTKMEKLVFIFPSGRGATIFPSWRTEIGQSIFLSPEPHHSDAHKYEAPYFDLKKDIVIPGYLDKRMAYGLLKRKRSWTTRRYLFTFVGGIHGRTRIKFFNYFGQLDRNDIFVSLKHINYKGLMGDSKFCPVIRGWSSWTLRFFETFWCECIPVLLSDHYIPPFTDMIDYSSFMIVHNENNMTGLIDRLLQVTPFEAQQKILNMRKYRCHLSYFKSTTRQCNAFENIGRMLQARKVSSY